MRSNHSDHSQCDAASPVGQTFLSALDELPGVGHLPLSPTPPGRPDILVCPATPSSSRHLSIATILLLLTFALPSRAAAAADPPPPQPFHVTARAADRSPTYDLLLDHHGLAQPDARDVRVLSPEGAPVSHFIAYADATRARVLFDGSAGPGDYTVHFGNLDPALPPVLEVAALGDKSWTPKGGYSVTSYGQVLPLTRRDVLGHKTARASFDRAAAAAMAKADEAKKPEDRLRLLRTTLLRSTAAELPGGYYHLFRAKVDLPAGGEYEIVLGSGAASELGVVYLDDQGPEPLIEGSFKTPDAYMVIATTAKLNLSAGPHEFRMYTTRRSPDLRLRATASAAPLRHLSGLDAHYDDCVRLAPSAIDSGPTPLPDAHLAAVRAWAEQGRFAHARALARYARAAFPGDAERDKLFAAEIDRAGLATYERNWLTEGKFPGRTNAVPSATTFAPPLRMSGATTESPIWDAKHNGSAVSVEGKIVYGLPFDVMLGRPWGVTSASAVDDDVLFVGAKNGVMHAVYVNGGAEKWTFAGGGACLGPPLVYQGVLYYGAMDRRLYAVDADRGRMLWNFPTGGWLEGGPAADGERVFFGSRDGNVYAVDAARGVERWHTDLAAPILATPAVAGGKVFVGTRGGDFAALDAATGRVLWKYPAGAAVVGGACAAENRVAFGDRAGRLHCLDAATGKPAWKSPADVKAPILAAPIMVGTTLFGGTESGTLFGVDLADGQLGWEAPMPGGGAVARPAIFANDTLTFTSRAHSPVGEDGKPIDLRGNTASFVPGPAAQNLKWARALSTITPDGDAGEPAWQVAEPLAPLLKPGGLSAPQPPADVRLLWDERNLYVAATIKAAPTADGGFTLLLDPRRNGQVVYALSVKPDGVKEVTLHLAAGLDKSDPKNKPVLEQLAKEEKQLAWSPNWTATTKATPAGWSAEIVIPLHNFPKPIPLPAANASWRINAVTRAAGKSWSLCPATATDPLGPSSRWPTVAFDPKPKP